ncbi:phosphoethanolamine transferase EptA [Rosenbergiella australiborealis]|uniref:phosphoethanolamine transferase EptA n=1 Tax=Rosenbergiella australiborealis TaxID=1544696 RepID=UPI001F4E7317|nr:phosphoethanolamine transferase EptA [Rosenbergiella australiborealis]
MKSWLRARLTHPVLNALTAVLITLCLNIPFFQKTYALISPNNAHTWLFQLSMPWVSFFVLFSLLMLAELVWLAFPLAIVFILLASSAQYFISAFGIVVDRSMIANMANTTTAESFALVTPEMIGYFIATAIIPIILLFLARRLTRQRYLPRIGYALIALLVSGAGLYLISDNFYKDYASLFRNNRELITNLSPSNGIAAGISWYKHERTANLPLIHIGEDAHQAADHLTGKPTLTILVVGETTRAQDVGLGGYQRQTTPLLAKDHVVYYPNTLSCGTSTAVSVPCMFSGMGHDHYNDELANHQEGLLDIVQRTGVHVFWRENDGGCKGACTRVPTEEMTSQNLPGMCIDGECYDQVLYHNLQSYIDKQTGNTLIVIHTIGSHGPTYNHRYPPQFKFYTPTCETNEVQHCSTEQLVNTYDNTIRYMDYIVDQGIQLLQANSQRFTTSLVYLSDHGESLGEDGVYLHGLPYMVAPIQQKHVPMLVWLSPDYQQRYAVNTGCMTEQANRMQSSQDNLFPTMLGLLGVQTKEYQPKLDLLNGCRGKA